MRIHVCQILFAFCLSSSALTAGNAQQPASDGQQQFADLGTCKLENGQQIAGCKLGYRTWGKLNAERTNAVLFPSYFSGTSSNLAGFVAANELIDPTKYFVIAVDAFGDGVSSSPSNSTAQPGPLFPAFTIRDMVTAEYRLATETLGLKHLHAVMGISMGGMQTFEWMVDYPTFMDDAIPIVGSPRLTGYDLLLWHTEEDALRSDAAWKNGHYTVRPPMGGVEAVHQMNLTTPANYAREHPPEKFAADYAAYYTNGILPFDANDWLYQLEAMIHHDAAHGGSMADAENSVRARVMIVVAAQDHMVNPLPAEDFAKAIGARVFVLDSDYGHISFGNDSEKAGQVVRAFLDGK
ncbi:MAG TPA: alpha/beta fold hydrolase [Terracidiphilus sp.]|jgi:homoserine O-acetyltransferase